MSLERGFSWEYGDWQFVGYSLAGITTSVFCKNASLCFDVGQGLPFQLSARRIALTHGHLDHAAGIPYLVAQKNMMGQKETEIFTPESLAPPLEQILKIWQEIDKHTYTYTMTPVAPGQMIELDRLYTLKPFATTHRVPSQGYILYQKKKRLKEKYKQSGQAGILAAKAAGENPNEEYLEAAVAFTGDTQVEFIDSDPDVARAKILFVEVTFWDDAKPVEHARKWGHMHFDELLGILPRLKNEKIVLIHASIRYSTAFLQKIMSERLPASERERVVLFPRSL
ncbi:MAG: MBL fold metallo-hydrolase [Bdellovibrionota bacterium]